MTAHVFISYAHEDGRFVLKLARHLQQLGLVLWLDQWNIGPGADWDKSIELALRKCTHFLLVMSPVAVSSWVVHKQFSQAKASGKIIIPVLYQPCQVPEALGQGGPQIDFVEDSYDVALGHLLRNYFPDREVQPNFGPILASTWRRLDWAWAQKVPALLWPGWLGPSILLLALFFSTLFIWSGQADESYPLEADLETLAVIPTATPLPFIRPTDGKAMAYVPAGEFIMGSSDDDPAAEIDEIPRHPVFLDAFWIDHTEITNGEYQRCVEAGACLPERFQGRAFAGATYPVVGVDWHQSAAYCRWVGGRLPTEAEWEKAARGIDERIYPWGNQFDGSRLNSCDRNCIQDWKNPEADDGYKYTAPVGIYPTGASPYGVLDMSGNVWEWTADWYAEDYYRHAALENPTGPSNGQQRVIRGGSWHYSGRNLRAVNRHKDIPTFRYDKIGFRCVVDDEQTLAPARN